MQRARAAHYVHEFGERMKVHGARPVVLVPGPGQIDERIIVKALLGDGKCTVGVTHGKIPLTATV